MLRLPRLVDPLHPRYQNDFFFQGKQLWTLKVDKHCNVSVLLQYQISHKQLPEPNRDAEQLPPLEAQTHEVLKFKFLHNSGGEEWLCQDPSQLGPTWLIIKPIQAASSSALLSTFPMLLLHREGWRHSQELQVRSTPGRGPDPVDTTPGRGHPCSQSHGTNLVLQPKCISLPTSYFCLLPFLSLPWHQLYKTIALALVTATGITTTAKIRILWGNANENNSPVHEKANIFLLLVESSSQRPREPLSSLLSNTNHSSHNKVWKTSFIFGNINIGLLENTLSFCINIVQYLTCLFWNGGNWLESSP